MTNIKILFRKLYLSLKKNRDTDALTCRVDNGVMENVKCAGSSR